MPREYLEYHIMKEMAWTYEELQDTPAEIVSNIIRYMNTEAKYQEQESKRHA